MKEPLKTFIEKVSADEALQAKLTAALEGAENVEQIPIMIEFAKQNGCNLTKEDFLPEQEDLSLNELSSVTGGGGCGCAAYGGGGGDDLRCGCFGYGTGGVKPKQFPSSQGGCQCFGFGAGATRRH